MSIEMIKKLFQFILHKSQFADYIEYYWIAYFLLMYLFPPAILKVDPFAGRAMEYHLFFEFIFGHATVGFAVANLVGTGKKRIFLYTFFLLIYGAFFVAMVVLMDAWVPVILFLLYIFEQYKRGLKDQNEAKKTFLAISSFLKMGIFMLALIPALFPWPKLGTSLVEFGFEGSGEFVDHPQKFIVFFIFYYLGIILFENKLKPKLKKISL